MAHASLRVHAPARDGVEMLTGKIRHRGRLRRLPTQRHELRPCWLEHAAFVEGAALQNGRSAVPAPGHAESGERFRQHGVLPGRLAPALSAVSRHQNLPYTAGSGIGDSGDLVNARLLQLHAVRRRGDEALYLLQEMEAGR